MIWNRMFLFVTTVVFVLALTISTPDGVVAGDEKEKKGPRIEVTKPVYDFGEVFRGEMIHHSFTIRNTGDEELKINDIDPDCGCTTVDLGTESLAPGESVQLDIKLNTITLERGEIEKWVRILNNDPGEPESIVTITGEIKVAVSINPSQIKLQGYKPGEPIPEQIVTITPMEGYDLEVRHVESNSKLITARIMESDGSGAVRIAVSIDSRTRRRTLPAVLRVFTNLEEEPFVLVSVHVKIDQPYTIAPYSISFKNVNPGFEGKLAYNVLLRNFRDEPLVVNEIKTSNEFIKCVLTTLEEGKKYRLNVGILPGFPPAGFKGTVEIHTNSKLYPMKEVAVEVIGIKKSE